MNPEPNLPLPSGGPHAAAIAAAARASADGPSLAFTDAESAAKWADSLPFATVGQAHEALVAQLRAVTAAEKHLEMYPDDARALYLGASALVTTGAVTRAREWAERALEADPGEPSILYNVGCMYSLMGDKDRAIALVDEAVQKGFGYRAWLEQDGDLDPIRGDPRFQAILTRLG